MEELKKWSLQVLNSENDPQSGTFNALSLRFDLDTGGPVFQLHFTNAQPMFERAFLTETTGSWRKGDIYFGFNIVRVFTLKKRNLTPP